jgi:hypothetical protein
VTCLPSSSGGWEVVDRDMHGLGVVPVVRLANRQRTADRVGRSEITPDVMSITDAACRRLMGIEVAAEFFGAPQRYILGASESAFQDAEGNAKSAWETYIGRMLALERDEDGNVPTVGQFSAHDPSGQTKIVDLYARIMASQMSVAPHVLGYSSDNPASADAIRFADNRQVKKAERRIRRLGTGWQQAMRLALWVRDGEPPDKTRRIETVWRNPATPDGCRPGGCDGQARTGRDSACRLRCCAGDGRVHRGAAAAHRRRPPPRRYPGRKQRTDGPARSARLWRRDPEP